MALSIIIFCIVFADDSSSLEVIIIDSSMGSIELRLVCGHKGDWRCSRAGRATSRMRDSRSGLYALTA